MKPVVTLFAVLAPFKQCVNICFGSAVAVCILIILIVLIILIILIYISRFNNALRFVKLCPVYFQFFVRIQITADNHSGAGLNIPVIFGICHSYRISVLAVCAVPALTAFKTVYFNDQLPSRNSAVCIVGDTKLNSVIQIAIVAPRIIYGILQDDTVFRYSTLRAVCRSIALRALG